MDYFVLKLSSKHTDILEDFILKNKIKHILNFEITRYILNDETIYALMYATVYDYVLIRTLICRCMYDEVYRRAIRINETYDKRVYESLLILLSKRISSIGKYYKESKGK